MEEKEGTNNYYVNENNLVVGLKGCLLGNKKNLKNGPLV